MSYDGLKGGQSPYDPRVMEGLLVYAYCDDITNPRKIELTTYDSVAFQVLDLDQHRVHETIVVY